ncbi:MAG TPA: TonB-dependent receptor, partial [Mariniphaga sp.]|nr:TonB-dependent receptor [Mariniphaga sp.]
QNSEFYFYYQKEELKKLDRINLEASNATIMDILDRALEGSNFNYSVLDRYIVLRKKGDGKELLSSALNAALSQQSAVTGTASNVNGQPLPGVTVVVKGTTQGTVTDAMGNYSLPNVPEDATLVFSFVGMHTQEVVVGNQSRIDVVMEEEAIGLEEVVAVGYGTQKRVNLTGSVASVNTEQLEARNVTKSSLLLQGAMSGIQVRQSSGNPTEDGASLLIRGQGTFSGAGTAPLILVDGIESGIDNLDPDDIESVSILKDASSAAIYGSKAANGVILVTTKQGKSGKPIVRIHSSITQSVPTMIPEMVNSWEYAEIVNEAYTNMGQAPRYTEDQIQKFRAGNDPAFPNFDHIDYLFGSGSGLQHKHSVGIQGGSQETQYLFSAGYYDKEGIIKKTYNDRYDLRLNLDSKLSESFDVSVKLFGYIDNNEQPNNGYDFGGLGGIVRGAMRNSNAIPGFTEDGYYGRNESLHPEADLNSKNFIHNYASYFYGNTTASWEIVNNLTLTGQVGYTLSNSQYKGFISSYRVTPNYGIDLNRLTTSWGKSDALTTQAIANYSNTFGNHAITLLGGVSGQAYTSNGISAFRDDLPSNDIHEINAGSTVRGTQGGSASRNTLASFFGRVNYNYGGKYLLESNFRYDGSSRFPDGNKFGFFPSFSAAWRISEEGFLQQSQNLSNLKVRGSWGELGNQSIGNYPYQDIIALGQNYPFGSEMAPGAAVTTVANKDIRWETTTITNVGIDLGFLDNKLEFVADYFIKKTENILYNVSVSYLLGASPSATNAGEVENRGWDFNLAYRNTAGDFSYGISGVFSIVHNKVLNLYGDLERDINRGLFVGYPIGSTFGYKSDGLIKDEAELANLPTQPFSVLSTPGGIKYLDISGPEGVPDGVVNSGYDRTIIGQPLPITTYGITLTGGYKNFSVNMLFQGEGGRVDMNRLEHFFPLDNNGNVQREAFENRWTEANPDVNAMYPRMVITTTDFYLQNPVDFWYRDATFIRLKNLQLSYDFPSGFLQNMSIGKARLYVTGENLFTITDYYDGFDPEMAVGGTRRFFPLLKSYSVGVEINF